MRQNERLALLVRMLDPDDYRYIRAYNFQIESEFRRRRMRIYRGALATLAGDILDSYQNRLANMNAAGSWHAYPGLAFSTASMFVSIGKLWIAAAMFQFRLPVIMNLAAQQLRLESFLSVEPISARPDRQPA